MSSFCGILTQLREPGASIATHICNGLDEARLMHGITRIVCFNDKVPENIKLSGAVTEKGTDSILTTMRAQKIGDRVVGIADFAATYANAAKIMSIEPQGKYFFETFRMKTPPIKTSELLLARTSEMTFPSGVDSKNMISLRDNTFPKLATGQFMGCEWVPGIRSLCIRIGDDIRTIIESPDFFIALAALYGAQNKIMIGSVIRRASFDIIDENGVRVVKKYPDDFTAR